MNEHAPTYAMPLDITKALRANEALMEEAAARRPAPIHSCDPEPVTRCCDECANGGMCVFL